MNAVKFVLLPLNTVEHSWTPIIVVIESFICPLGDLCDRWCSRCSWWAEVSSMPTVPMLVMQNKVTPTSEKTFWMIMAQCGELRPTRLTRQGYTEATGWLYLRMRMDSMKRTMLSYAFITALITMHYWTMIQIGWSFNGGQSHTHTHNVW